MELKENALTLEIYQCLRENVGWMNLDAEQAKKAVEKSLYTLTAFEGEKPVGMGRIVGDGMYHIICDIVVRPEYQGQGIGTKLVTELVRFLEEQTPEGGRSSVQLIAEKGKEGFYEKLGFKALPHEFCGAGMRRVIRR